MVREATMAIVSVREDIELLPWLRWSEKNGSSVVRAVVEAAILADIPHYLLLRPVLLKLKEMHPEKDL